jgi:dCTP deaminase
VQPASVDVALSDEAFEIPASFLPNGRLVRDVLSATRSVRMTPDDEGRFHLDVDRIYLFRLQELPHLPAGIHACFNAKSSTGRLDIFARVIADHGRHFDLVPVGYEGEIWLEVVPRSFPVVVRSGSRLAQMRLVKGGARPLSPEDLRDRPEFRESLIREGLEISVDLTPCSDGIRGWVARQDVDLPAIDVDRVDCLDPRGHFEPIRLVDDTLVLVPSRFYILRSREEVVVPDDLSSEMISADNAAGEFRVHYAGFFDPGFGLASDKASRAVLEVRARDVPFALMTGQVVGRLAYHAMGRRPSRPYGSAIGSNYQGQGLRLSKHFTISEKPDAMSAEEQGIQT